MAHNLTCDKSMLIMNGNEFRVHLYVLVSIYILTKSACNLGDVGVKKNFVILHTCVICNISVIEVTHVLLVSVYRQIQLLVMRICR